MGKRAQPETWQPAEPDVESIREQYAQPFEALAEGETPALILRNAVGPEDCAAVLQRLRERDVIRPPGKPGSFDYVGTSLGMMGANPDEFFADAKRTHALYATLFEGIFDPIKWTYETLNRLAVGHRVAVAQEPDGRRYGPGIFRYYPPGRGHFPHFDSVRLREKRVAYSVNRYPGQFSSILCLQAPEPHPEAGEGIVHRARWNEEIQPHLDAHTFPEYAEQHDVANARVELEVGDFYVFNTLHIHEVPPILGDRARIVLAMFMGFDPDEELVPVWS